MYQKAAYRSKSSYTAVSQFINDKPVKCEYCGLLIHQSMQTHQEKPLCVMLEECNFCKKIVQVSTLSTHLLYGCQQSGTHRKCSRCHLAIHKREYEKHESRNDCPYVVKGSGHEVCPRCFKLVNTNDSIAWRRHLLRQCTGGKAQKKRWHSTKRKGTKIRVKASQPYLNLTPTTFSIPADNMIEKRSNKKKNILDRLKSLNDTITSIEETYPRVSYSYFSEEERQTTDDDISERSLSHNPLEGFSMRDVRMWGNHHSVIQHSHISDDDLLMLNGGGESWRGDDQEGCESKTTPSNLSTWRESASSGAQVGESSRDPSSADSLHSVRASLEERKAEIWKKLKEHNFHAQLFFSLPETAINERGAATNTRRPSGGRASVTAETKAPVTSAISKRDSPAVRGRHRRRYLGNTTRKLSNMLTSLRLLVQEIKSAGRRGLSRSVDINTTSSNDNSIATFVERALNKRKLELEVDVNKCLICKANHLAGRKVEPEALSEELIDKNLLTISVLGLDIVTESYSGHDHFRVSASHGIMTIFKGLPSTTEIPLTSLTSLLRSASAIIDRLNGDTVSEVRQAAKSTKRYIATEFIPYRWPGMKL